MPPREEIRLGLGTWQNTDPEECAESVAAALEAGYRHVDTAQGYGNEASVGEGLERADVPREDVLVATKVSSSNLAYDDVVETTEGSLERLGVETIDLLYVHWPTTTYDPEETIAAFDELYDRGAFEYMGLSNFPTDLADEALALADAPILANQVEMHPLLQQEATLEHARENDMWLVAYSPLATGRVFEIPELSRIAEKHGASEAQVALAWLLSKEGVAAIPKARGEHIHENYAALDLDLDPSDVDAIDGIDREERLFDSEEVDWD